MLQNKNKKSESLDGRRVTALFVIVLLVLFNVAYAIIASDHMSQRYVLEKRQSVVLKATEERQLLLVAAAQLQSSDRIRQASDLMKLVKADAPTYIAPLGPVALNH